MEINLIKQQRYQCSDGSFFEDKEIAEKHEAGLLMRKDIFESVECCVFEFVNKVIDSIDFEKYKTILPLKMSHKDKYSIVLNNLYRGGKFNQNSMPYRIFWMASNYKKQESHNFYEYEESQKIRLEEEAVNGNPDSDVTKLRNWWRGIVRAVNTQDGFEDREVWEFACLIKKALVSIQESYHKKIEYFKEKEKQC